METKDYYHEALDELEELISEMHKISIFEVKSPDELINKIRHVNLFDSFRISDYSESKEVIIDVDYKHIQTTISFYEPDGCPKIASYVDYWPENEEEPYEYNGSWFDEQRED